jgi:hypothetical protein
MKTAAKRTGGLTVEQTVLSDLAAGPLKVGYFVHVASFNAIANLTRKGLAEFVTADRAYRITSKGASFLSRL